MVDLESCGLGARLAVFREATRTVWGDAAVDTVLANVGEESRAALTPGAVNAEWVPERIFVECIIALWEGPCGRRDSADFRRWVDVVTDRGFAEARELLISLGSPFLVLRRANELWHYEHSHGKLTFAPLDARSARLSLRDHPFIDHESSRVAMGEAFRYIIALSGAADVTETHSVDAAGVLQVILAWREPLPGGFPVDP
ncbi:MAG: hypothetical protein ABIP39_15690 [Polyangiaceae bacterium]